MTARSSPSDADGPAPLPGAGDSAPRLAPPRFQTGRTVMALILREMSSTYGRSPGGYLWAVLEPLGAILLLSIGFSLLIRAPSLGTSFILFYATGYMPFSIYTDLQGKLTRALQYSRALLAYPRVTWLDAVLARVILNVLTNIAVAFLLFGGILIFVETRAILSLGPILLGTSLVVAFGVGVGTMNCLLGGLWPVWLRIYGILSRPLFLASGIFFLYEDMPPLAQEILWWNPILHAVGEMRRGFYPTYEASYVSLGYGFGVSFLLIAAALLFLRRYHLRVLET